jgi:D-glycero-D-manno-heptose 1,7-bisphosphate phosphatase
MTIPAPGAVFLDRDGTVNEEVGYLSELSQLRLIPGAAEAIRRLNEAGLPVVLVTNQSGVARGYFPEAFVEETHRLLKKLLAGEGARLDAIYYCPHHPTAGDSRYTAACNCRKPATGLLDSAARDLKIDLHRSYMVGDKWSDVELGQRAGALSILVATGFAADAPVNRRPAHVREPDLVAPDLAAAVDWILSREGGKGV